MMISSLKNIFRLANIKISKTYFFLISSLIITILLKPERNSVFSDSLNIIFTLIILLNVFIFFKKFSKLYASWIRYDTLFILGFLIVHFQIPFLASFGIEPQRPHLVWHDKNVVNFATWFSAMALLLWMFGFCWYLKRKKTFSYNLQKYYIKSRLLKILLIVFFFLFIFLVGSDFLMGSYSGTRNWGSGAVYVFSFLHYFVLLNVFYFFKNNEGKLLSKMGILQALRKNIFIVSIIVGYLLIFLLSGDRGPILQIGLLIFGLYTIYQKRIGFKSFFFFITLGATLFFIISYGRTRDASSREGNIISQGIDNFKESDEGINPTGELAYSVRILYRALDIVPEKHPHLYGLTLVFNVIDVFPFGGSTFIDELNLPMMYTSSSSFFTILKKGKNFSAGDGSEVIADLYINIGVWPTLIVFLFFGYMISYFSLCAFYSKNHYYVLVYIILLTTSIYINRATFLTPLKTIVWCLIIDKLLTKKVIA